MDSLVGDVSTCFEVSDFVRIYLMIEVPFLFFVMPCLGNLESAHVSYRRYADGVADSSSLGSR